jgi:hypothetical protein
MIVVTASFQVSLQTSDVSPSLIQELFGFVQFQLQTSDILPPPCSVQSLVIPDPLESVKRADTAPLLARYIVGRFATAELRLGIHLLAKMGDSRRFGRESVYRCVSTRPRVA